MNTKQIWNALSRNENTNNFFDGVFSIDTLKEIKEKPKLIICNTDPSSKPGEHWVLFFFNDNYVEFYDSYGNDISYYGTEFINFIKKFVSLYELTNIQTQPDNTSLCGYYCLYYALLRCKNYSMKEIINNMIKNVKNIKDIVMKNFYICNYSSCKFLQCCKKIN